MKYQATIVIAAIAICGLTLARADEATFKDALINAAQSNDSSAIMNLTCLDGVTPEWKAMLEQSNLALLRQFQEKSPYNVELVPFAAPQPEPIAYKEMKLVPNLPITTICRIVWPSGEKSTANPTSTDIRLGMKDGKLMIVALVPQNQ